MSGLRFPTSDEPLGSVLCPSCLDPYAGLNGGEGLRSTGWAFEAPGPLPAQRQAVSCDLSFIVDDAIELLTLIDQPAYYSEGSR